MALTGGWFVWDEHWSEQADEKGRLKSGSAWTRLTLADGRDVELEYGERGLTERHQSTAGGSMSKPRLLFRSEEVDCENITVATHEGTVAAIAGFGGDCPAGNPPDLSVATVRGVVPRT